MNKKQLIENQYRIEVQLNSFIRKHNLVFVTLTQNNETKTEKIVLTK